MELVNEVKLGVVKGTGGEEAVEGNFRGGTAGGGGGPCGGGGGGGGFYRARARQSQREGYPEVAEALIRIAWEEAGHAAGYAELAGKISPSTRENLGRMLQGGGAAHRGKREAAVKDKGR